MRENKKFRAWDKEKCRWVYIHLQPPGKIVLPSSKYTRISFPSHDMITQLVDCEKWYQYIGHKDKNGKEIYESDIIEANIKGNSVPTMGKVVFDNEYSCWVNKNLSGITMMWRLNKIEVKKKLDHPLKIRMKESLKEKLGSELWDLLDELEHLKKLDNNLYRKRFKEILSNDDIQTNKC